MLVARCCAADPQVSRPSIDLGVSVRHSSDKMGKGCFADRDLGIGAFSDGDGKIYTLRVASKLPSGTQQELHEVGLWENDKALVEGKRVNKYWPIASSLLRSDMLVAFEDEVLPWDQLIERGFTIDCSYPRVRERFDPAPFPLAGGT